MKISQFALVIASFLPSIPVMACSCFPGAEEQSFNSSDSVFQGKVESISAVKFPVKVGSKIMEATKNAVTFKVADTFKGQGGASHVVYVQIESAACGVDFEVGKEYKVFAYRTEIGKHPAPEPVGELATDSCTHTGSIHDE